MAVPLRKVYVGNVPRTSLQSTITSGSTTIVLLSATNWPASGPFVIALERGTANEEKVLIASRSGATLTVTTRGYDGTTAVGHTASATCYIEHVVDADTLDKANLIASTAGAAGNLPVGDGTTGHLALAIGATGQLLTADTSVSNYKMKWATLTMPPVYTSSTRPSPSVLGQEIFESDTGIVQICTAAGSPGTWVPRTYTGAWTSFTPQLDQGATTNIAKTTNFSEWMRQGSQVTWEFDLTITGAGTAGSSVTLTVPVNFASSSAGGRFGSSVFYDASVPQRYAGGIERVSATQVGFDNAGGTSGLVGLSPNIAVANGDLLRGMAIYRV